MFTKITDSIIFEDLKQTIFNRFRHLISCRIFHTGCSISTNQKFDNRFRKKCIANLD